MYAYRRAVERDQPLIVDSWLESYRCSHAAGLVSMDSWRDVMTPEVLRVLARPGVQTWVAYQPEEQSTRGDLAGWISVERDYEVPMHVLEQGRRDDRMVPCSLPLVHYVYVKAPYRNAGIARGLFSAAGVLPREEFLYTCKVGLLTRLASKVPLARWQPLIARYSK